MILKEEDITNLQKGIEILNKYGYTENLAVRDNASFHRIYDGFSRQIVIFLILVVVLFITLMYIVLHKMYSRLNEFSIGIEKIMSGEYESRLPVEGEGQLAMLGFQFNLMSKRLQLTLDDLNEEKEKLKVLISDISHQLKNPLASVRMFNELLLDGEDEDKEIRKEFLERSSEQIDRMEWLIQNLLQISRLESGVIKMQFADIGLEETLQQVIESVSKKAEEKKQKINLQISKSSIIYPQDQRWLGEAFKNIIFNAIQYTDVGGWVEIRLLEMESTIKLEIEDNGVGIKKDDLPHIFDRFYRGQNIERQHKGTGIGLALSKLIIEEHAGLIDVESRLNKGTLFTITFPTHAIK